MAPDLFAQTPLFAALPADLRRTLRAHIGIRTKPGPKPFPALSLSGVGLLADRLGLSSAEAMAFALEHDVWPLRFAAGKGAFSATEQALLLRRKAAIIGCGGLGGSVLGLLARLGLGALTLCDFDVFDESNLNRQHLAREDRIGRNKAAVAAEELAAIASHMAVRVVDTPAEPDNLPDILAGAHVTVDCLDSLGARLDLEQAAHAAGIPLVHGAIAGFEGFAGASLPGTPLLRSLYGNTPPEAGAETLLGVPTPTPAFAACLQVMEVLKILLGRPSGGLLHFDMAAPELERLGV